MMDRDNLIVLITKKRLNRKLSSWEVDAAEFVNKVKNQVRKRQKNVERCRFRRRAFNNLGMFMAATMNAATFMGKNFVDNENSIKNSTDLNLKKCSTSQKNW